MHDIKKIRENPSDLDELLAKRKHPPVSNQIIELDEKNRKIIGELQVIQEERNAKSKLIGEYAAKEKNDEAAKLKAEVTSLKDKMQELENSQREKQEELNTVLSSLPNNPADDVPVGDESLNKEIKLEGNKKEFTFTPKEHDELGENLDMMSFEQATKISGARFVVQSGLIARMERAISNFMLDLHTNEFGYTEMNVPILVKDQSVYGVGQLPKFKDDLFKTTDDYWLIPTAEVPLSNMTRESIIDILDLPKRYVSHTPCFRSEAGAAGKDTRGIMRQHQFYKVELVSLTSESQSKDEHERMLSCAEEVLKRLNLHYRVVILSSEDMGFAAQKTYDIEVWLPGQKAYREISSCSNCGDFQARRMNSRYKEGKETKFLHTLNGSGLAVGRTLISILENYQNEDGTIQVPDALIPYMGGINQISN
ncbi:MAG: serine--tRNA ligase [Candidatus Pelagibacterales bacterium]|nr:MAG: serine--tRNA ligase [Pelagibacterales bacterium]